MDYGSDLFLVVAPQHGLLLLNKCIVITATAQIVANLLLSGSFLSIFVGINCDVSEYFTPIVTDYLPDYWQTRNYLVLCNTALSSCDTALSSCNTALSSCDTAL